MPARTIWTLSALGFLAVALGMTVRDVAEARRLVRALSHGGAGLAASGTVAPAALQAALLDRLLTLWLFVLAGIFALLGNQESLAWL